MNKVIVSFIASILMLSTCVAQEESLFRNLESQLAKANEQLKQEKLLLDKQLEEKPQQIASTEAFDSAIEQIIAVRTKIEEALKSHTADQSELKSSSLEGASPEQIADLLETFRKQTWSKRDSFADHLLRTNQFNAAVKQLKTAISEMETVYGDEYPVAINWNAKLGTAKWLETANESEAKQFRVIQSNKNEAVQLLRAQKPQQAVEKLTAALQELESLGLTDSLAYAESLANIAEGFFMLKDIDEAQVMFDRAIKHNDVLFKKKSPTNANLRRSFSNVYKAMGKHDRAVALLEESDQIYQAIQSAYPEPPFSQAMSIYMRGQNIQALKSYKEATLVYYQAVDVTQAANEKRLTVALVQAVGECHDALNDVNASPSAMAEKSLEIGKTIFGAKDAAKVANWLMTIAKLKRGQDKPEDSVAMFETTEAFFHTVPQRHSSPIYHACVQELLKIHSSNKQWEKSAKYSDEIAQCALSARGKNSTEYGRSLTTLGVMHGHNKDFEKAEKSFDLAHEILKTHIVGTREHINLLLARAFNLKKAQRWEDGIPFWKQLEELSGPDSSVEKNIRRSIVQGLVESYRATDQPELADQYSTELKN